MMMNPVVVLPAILLGRAIDAALDIWAGTVYRTKRRYLEAAGNQAGATIDWRFSTEDARVKMRHLYPAKN